MGAIRLRFYVSGIVIFSTLLISSVVAFSISCGIVW